MSKEQATALLNFIGAQPDAFNAACDEAAGEGGDGAALADGIVEALSGDAGETEGEEENA